MDFEEIKKKAFEIAKLQEFKEEQPINEVILKEEDINNNQQIQIIQDNTNNIDNKISEIISTSYDNNLQQIQKSKEFSQRVTQNAVDKVDNQLRKDKLENLNEKQMLELGEHILNCEKQKLSYRKKKEKQLVKLEVKCEIAQRKYDALFLRYGYMYKDKTSFIPSKFYNQFKELVNWYNGTGALFRKIIKGTILLFFSIAIGYVLFNIGKFGLGWFIENFEIKK